MTEETPSTPNNEAGLNKTILVPKDEDALPYLMGNRKAYFPRDMQLSLYILETDKHITSDFENILILGREQTSFEPSLDLSEHGAIRLGVSRRHAKLIRSKATLMIEDLGTLNGTFLNGERLLPGHSHVICDGDELKLAAMVMAIVFEKKAPKEEAK
jgi:hypothetical protein